MDSIETLAEVLAVKPELLLDLDKDMTRRLGRSDVLKSVADENEAEIRKTLQDLDIKSRSAVEVRKGLQAAILADEAELLRYLEALPGKDKFEKAAHLARSIAKVGPGFFLKKEYAKEILRKRPPQELLNYLKVADVETLIANYDVTEVFSALRFVESEDWMHETFDAAYGQFTAADFEERAIEVRVLGPVWHDVGEKFAAKKHHNVSHLKEFGVIFLNPLEENMPGKFLRDFALFFHYFHEIEFYSKLFHKYAGRADFAEHLKSLLRGDVAEASEVKEGEWLIVQRYLAKTDATDPRLFLPRVNPESMHWARGERDLTSFAGAGANLSLRFWHDHDWVGGVFEDGAGEAVSFDLEDNVMSAVSATEGQPVSFHYHEREALWTRLFSEYAGGEERMEELLIENFDKGLISFIKKQ